MSIVGKYTFASDDGKVEAFFNVSQTLYLTGLVNNFHYFCSSPQAMGTPAEMMPVALAMSKAEIEITANGDEYTMGNEAKKVTFTLGKEFDESYGDRTAKITVNKTGELSR